MGYAPTWRLPEDSKNRKKGSSNLKKTTVSPIKKELTTAAETERRPGAIRGKPYMTVLGIGIKKAGLGRSYA